MTERKEPHIGDIPAMKPARDEVASYQRKKHGSMSDSIGQVPETGASLSSVYKVILTILTLALLGSLGWAAMLQDQLQTNISSSRSNEIRIQELEQRLSITDEAMSDSAVSMQVKVKEMDHEIRKLWDNVWKRSKKIHAEHEALLKKHGDSIKRSDAVISKMEKRLISGDKTMSTLSKQLKNLESLQARLTTQQQSLLALESQLESTADKVNGSSAQYQQLMKRVEETEGWIESINGFRRQVNGELNLIKQQMGQLQSSQSAPNSAAM